MDATERGNQYFKQITDAYLKFALDVLENHANPKELKKLGFGFGRDSRLILRAVKLDLLDGTEVDYWRILKAMECAKCKNDIDAAAIFERAVTDAGMTWNMLTDAVKKSNDAHRHPRAKKADAGDVLKSLVPHLLNLVSAQTWLDKECLQDEAASVTAVIIELKKVDAAMREADE